MTKLAPKNITVLVDSREKTPFDLKPLRMVKSTLQTGDYSIKGLEHLVAVERKSLADLCGCVGRDRERFDREMQRIMAFESRLLIIEATWAEIEAGKYRSKVHPNAVIGSLCSWAAKGMNVWLAGSHKEAQVVCSKFLYTVARRRWAEALNFIPNLKLASGGDS